MHLFMVLDRGTAVKPTRQTSFLEALEARRFFALTPLPLDPSFAAGGKIVADLNETDYVEGMLVQPDGKILVAVGEMTLLRFRPDGSPDRSFGNNGRVTLPTPDTIETIGALALRPGGKILLAGLLYPIPAYVVQPQMPDSDTLLMRLNGDGSV